MRILKKLHDRNMDEILQNYEITIYLISAMKALIHKNYIVLTARLILYEIVVPSKKIYVLGSLPATTPVRKLLPLTDLASCESCVLTDFLHLSARRFFMYHLITTTPDKKHISLDSILNNPYIEYR